MSAVPSMPARGDRNAPQFDSHKPHELRRYFTDLEFLLNRASVTDNAEKKQHATRFLSVEDQEIWEALPSYSDPAKSYAEFKADALKLYAGNNEDRRFELSDLDALIGQYSRVGILSIDDLTTFYRQFLRITTYLIAKNRLSNAEQSRSFLRAMQPASFSVEVRRRLQIKQPDVHPADPYALADLYEAAEFVLAGSGSTLIRDLMPGPLASPSPATVEVKPDPGIAALVGTMAELIKVLATQRQSGDSNGAGSAQKRPRPDGCGYCSDLSHFINECDRVLEDIQAGKCRRNAEGRVVLPTGAFVPRTIVGKDLRSRIEKWHELHPGQLAAAQLMVDVAVDHLYAPSPSPTPRTTTLSDGQRMQFLQHEMNALRTRAQAKRALESSEQDEPDRTIPSSGKAPAPPVAAVPTVPTTQPSSQVPQHPFSNARDAAYAPPKDRNLGLPSPVQSKSTPAYRTSAPVYNEKHAADVFESSLNTPITITQRQLLSIAPEVRSHMREVTTSRRAPPKENKDPASQLENDIAPLPFFDNLTLDHDSFQEQRAKDARRVAFLDSLPASYTYSAGGIVVPDPFEVFYTSGDIPDDLIVSLESSAIRSILPVIDNQQQVESIVDGGSQIVAMSEAICHELGLAYDPRIILRMQSANGAVSPSLGLARNVPFRIGDIILYLQVHIVRNPAYDVLLGRPFDVLTQSIIRNFANEDQTITICDPNTGKLATVPTVPRGPPRHRQQGFSNSRN
ncbi:hypothetical protein DFH08DRAFT_817512 [Mycena albidolilacea]|uniref:Peptidase A2 domain-containing protein n=1 Tax=Mycena albidolilacea TaxID=1033008 RepID=A0AAD7EH18_9AGAR|nr:hypothetical protein DFH08DRAFT_817512 [Mycena albidolilacea]